MSSQPPPLDSEGQRAASRPWSSIWIGHYDRASRRRHRMGGYRRLRKESKRKRRRELVALAAGAVSVLALFSVFCAILTR